MAGYPMLPGRAPNRIEAMVSDEECFILTFFKVWGDPFDKNVLYFDDAVRARIVMKYGWL